MANQVKIARCAKALQLENYLRAVAAVLQLVPQDCTDEPTWKIKNNSVKGFLCQVFCLLIHRKAFHDLWYRLEVFSEFRQ